jgi:hypothetical protein
MTQTCKSKTFQTAALIARGLAAAIAMTVATTVYAQNTTLPDHDPEATLNGTTALEHAEGLERAHPMHQLNALKALAEMETDALPAFDAVRATAERARAPEMTDKDADDVRIGALSVLVSMQAPEAVNLVREKILDPDYFARDIPYTVLLESAGRIGIADDVFLEDLLSLVDRMPDHATRLMALDALVDPTQGALEQAVFNSDHDSTATEHFLVNLADLAFLDDDAKVAYVADHRQIAEHQADGTRDALAGIGTEAALDLAMQLGGQQDAERLRTISRFAGGAMPAQEIADRFLAEAQAKSSKQEIRQVMSLFESSVNDMILEAEAPEDRAAYRRLFIDANGTLIADGPTDTHVLVGITRQILYLQRHDDLPLEPALGPIFDLLEAGSVSPAIYNSVAESLQVRPSAIAAHDPEYFITRTLALLWDADTPELANLPVSVLTALMRERGYAEPVVAQIADQIGPYQNSWAVNPAAAVAIFSGTLPWLDHTPVREAAAGVMGKVFVSPAIDMNFLLPYLGRGGGNLARLDHNTVDGVISVFTPTIFPEEKPETYPIAMESFMQPMLGRPAWLQQDPEAMATWIKFLERVAALNDSDFSPIARQALSALGVPN